MMTGKTQLRAIIDGAVDEPQRSPVMMTGKTSGTAIGPTRGCSHNGARS